MLDLRIPCGLFFVVTGIILLGASTGSPHAPLEDANVDLYAGAAMLVLGGSLLGLARVRRRPS